MKVKELIEKLKEYDWDKDVEFKFYYQRYWTDCDIYYTDWETQEILNKVYFTIKRK